jgi:hypothetical protein
MSLQLWFPFIPIIIGLIILRNLAPNLVQRRKESYPTTGFFEAEQKFKRLKDKFNTQELSETKKKLLQDIMVQDGLGRWWTIGYETGQWYVHDGEKWVLSVPPTTEYISSTSGPKAVKKSMPASKIWLSGLAGLILLVWGLIWLAANLGFI